MPKPKTSKKSKTDPLPGFVQYVRSAAVASTLLSVAAMMFLPEFFYMFIGLVYAAILIWTADIFYKFRVKGLKAKATVIVVGLTILSLFTFGFVWIKAPLGLLVQRNVFPYRPGETIAGIKWSEKFNELRITLHNPTSYDYQDLDIVIKVDQPVVDIAQVSKLPGVTFLDPNVKVIMVEVKKKAANISLVPVAAISGQRVRAEKLPRKSALEIVMANANVNGSFPDIVDVKMSNGDRYWYVNKEILGMKGIDEVYLFNKPRVQVVKVDGEYTVLQRKKNITRTWNIK